MTETESQMAERIRGLVEARAEKRGRHNERREIIADMRQFQVLINNGHELRIGDIIAMVEARATADRRSPR